MTRKNLLLIAAAVVLFATAAYFVYSDYFGSDGIQIYHRISNRDLVRRRTAVKPGATVGEVNPVLFGLNRKLRFTSVRVVMCSELATNKYAHAVWDLVTESNSVPIKSFNYGQAIKGMHSNVKGLTAEPLQPDVQYHLTLETEAGKAEHNFSTTLKAH